LATPFLQEEHVVSIVASQQSTQTKARDLRRVWLFSAATILYSWPIFFLLDAWVLPGLSGETNTSARWLTALFGHMLAMAGPALAAMLLWRVHKEPAPPWKWGRPRHYALAAASMLSLWAVPGLLMWAIGDGLAFRDPLEPFVWVFVASNLTLLWLAGLGEEMGWVVYLLPRLEPHIGRSRALLVAGAIRGLWHWPVLFGPVLARYLAGGRSVGLLVLAGVAIAIQLVISNALFGVLFGWVWYKTESLPLLGWLHQWFDAARDVTALMLVGYASTMWARAFWGIPFYVVACMLLQKIAKDEKAGRWLAPRQAV
jgi:membrane protease YdiL (CAAX protease family)